ncbi:MAG TPA: YdeI/OmpD-associated family protein, partial [Chloroflexia bacterium]|nr:YdeI/OmpD-associated family protein [Chloroflexia bacterium]
GKPSITWPEAVDQALCFGWIDGIRKSVDADSYMNRFTPRRPRSTWSAVNIKRVQELTEAGLMRPAGIAAFEKRTDDNSAIYSYEQRDARLDPEYERQIRANEAAWNFFQAQPPWYRRTASRWVMSAKREETRRKRLAALIEDSAHGRTIPPLTRNNSPGKNE